jgi:hypothetical protein
MYKAANEKMIDAVSLGATLPRRLSMMAGGDVVDLLRSQGSSRLQWKAVDDSRKVSVWSEYATGMRRANLFIRKAHEWPCGLTAWRRRGQQNYPCVLQPLASLISNTCGPTAERYVDNKVQPRPVTHFHNRCRKPTFPSSRLPPTGKTRPSNVSN